MGKLTSVEISNIFKNNGVGLIIVLTTERELRFLAKLFPSFYES